MAHMRPAQRLLRCLTPGLILLTALSAVATAAPSPQAVAQLYGEVSKEYRNTFALVEKEQRVEALRRCIERLQQVLREDTRGEFADRSLYLIAQSHHHLFDATQNREDFKSALEHYRMVTYKFPLSPLADDAQFLVGILCMPESPGQAYIEFARVGLFFPKGDMHAKAARMADQMAKQLGRKETTSPVTSPAAPASLQKKEVRVASVPPQAVEGSARTASRKSTPEAKPQEPPSPSLKPGGKENRLTSQSLARQLALDIRCIVIDPGHGGKDKGAISTKGVYEKDIVLAIAKELEKALEDRTGCEVVLTRTRDVFVSLEERTALANAKKADLFISIHTNAHEDARYFGTETYYLNLSNDKESARVAAMENAAAGRKMSDLEAILHDLLLNTRVNESARLASDVQGQLVRKLKANYESVRDLGTKPAPFFVLIGAEMPGILVETAFLTNDVEECRLRDKRFRAHLATGIASGIEAYMAHMKSLAKAGDGL